MSQAVANIAHLSVPNIKPVVIQNVEDAERVRVGDSYSVLCAHGLPNSEYAVRGGITEAWFPVIGRPHTDPELGVRDTHLHCDERFMTDHLLHLLVSNYYPTILDDMIPVLWIPPLETGTAPLMGRQVLQCVREFPRRACINSGGARCHPGTMDQMRKLEEQYGDKKIGDCRVCPHRGTSLAQVAPDEHGVITCPAHLMRWELKSGKLLRRY